MARGLVGLIDAGFVTRSAARWFAGAPARYVGTELVDWLRITSKRLDLDFLRAYWYDGAYPHGDQNYENQRQYFAELEACPGIQLRLGHLEPRSFDFKPALRAAAKEIGIDYPVLMQHFRPERFYQQKGVDTLLVLDMIRLVQQKACATIVLMAGDRDLAEAVRAVQELGCTVVLAYPDQAPVAVELRNLADIVVVWTEPVIRRLTSTFIDRLDALFDDGKPEIPARPE